MKLTAQGAAYKCSEANAIPVLSYPGYFVTTSGHTVVNLIKPLMILIYVPRVVNMSNLLVSTTLEL